MTRYKILVFAAGLALVAGILSTGPASANLGHTPFVNIATGTMCLDATNDATHNPGNNGDPVQLWSCNGGTQQFWNFNENVGPYGTVTNGYAGLCLDARDDATHSPGNNGDPAQLWSCNGGTQQQWRLVSQVSPPGYSWYVLENLYSSGQLVLDATNAATHNPGNNGDPVQLWSYNGMSNQVWSF